MNGYFLTVVFCGTLLQNIPIQNEYIYKSSFILSYFYVLLALPLFLFFEEGSAEEKNK